MLRALLIAAVLGAPALAPALAQDVDPLFVPDTPQEDWKSGETDPATEIDPVPEAAAPPVQDEPRLDNNVAVFSGLDKITGRITEFDVWIGETVQFGVLQVTPRVCYSRPQTEQPKTSSFIEIDEVTLERKMKRIFTGWVFAESPGLNAMEHPVNDVWLKGCRETSTVPAPPGFVMRSNAPVETAKPDVPRAGDASDDLTLDPGESIADDEGNLLPPADPQPTEPAAPPPGSPQTLEEFLALPDEPIDQ